ncbi:hypothetical protein PV325_005553 [Microctonus aethiopoides]|nr:hypothetical protein PV325_005553 [Microctonus aethiopoides]
MRSHHSGLLQFGLSRKDTRAKLHWRDEGIKKVFIGFGVSYEVERALRSMEIGHKFRLGCSPTLRQYRVDPETDAEAETETETTGQMLL